MDRRQKKTRAAIFEAFSSLMAEKSYSKITVQDIIDIADIGRTTFYAHFETKDELLRSLCQELFQHIVGTAMEFTHTRGLYGTNGTGQSVFCHLLHHLQENDYHILNLLSSDSGQIFLEYFRDSLNELVRDRLAGQKRKASQAVPEEFLVSHISGSFVELVLWWVRGHMKQSPEELDRYFRMVIEPII